MKTNGTRNPSRILFVEGNTDGTVGGSHQAQYDLIQRLDRSSYTPVALFYQANRFADMLRDEGVEVYTWDEQRKAERRPFDEGKGRFAKLTALLGAIRVRTAFLRKARIDMIHVNNSPFYGWYDWVPAAKRVGARYIATMNGDAKKGPPSNPIARWLFHSPDRVIAISKYIRDAAYSVGFGKAQVELVYHGVDIPAIRARASRPPADVRVELGVGDGQVMVSMVGHLREWKGQAVVLDALARLAPEHRERLRLFFVGGVPDYSKDFYAGLQETVRREDLEECVTFLGERKDVPDLMHSADIVLHASITPEPFGLVIVEGLVHGKPVIAARAGGGGEIITEGAGFTFDTAKPEELTDCLEKLIDDVSLRSTMGEKASLRAAEFSADRMADEIQRVYAEVLNG